MVSGKVKKMDSYNRITLYMVVLIVLALVFLPCTIAQTGGRNDMGNMGGDRGMMGGAGRGGVGGDRGMMGGSSGRGGGIGDSRGGRGRGGPQINRDEQLTDQQIDRIIKSYSEKHSQEEVQQLQEQRKTMSRDRFMITLMSTASWETIEEIREDREYTPKLQTLEKFMTDEAKGIRELQDENYSLYKQRIDSLYNKYRPIWQKITNPGTPEELIRVIVQDFQLQNKERDLTRQYIFAQNQEQKKSLLPSLEDVINKRYDLIVTQKEIQYQQIQDELKKLQDRVELQLKDVERWKDEEFKRKEVERELNTITNPPSFRGGGPFRPNMGFFMSGPNEPNK